MMGTSRDSVAVTNSGKEDGCCYGGVVWVGDGSAILGLHRKHGFVCLRSKFLCMHTSEVHAQNFKEAMTLTRNTCSGIIVPPNLRLFCVLVSCGEISFLSTGGNGGK